MLATVFFFLLLFCFLFFFSLNTVICLLDLTNDGLKLMFLIKSYLLYVIFSRKIGYYQVFWLESVRKCIYLTFTSECACIARGRTPGILQFSSSSLQVQLQHLIFPTSQVYRHFLIETRQCCVPKMKLGKMELTFQPWL